MMEKIIAGSVVLIALFIVITHAEGFSTVANGLSQNYSKMVTALQGR